MARPIKPLQPMPGEMAAEAFANFIFDKSRRETYMKELRDTRDDLNKSIGTWNKKKKADALLRDAEVLKADAVAAAEKLTKQTRESSDREKKSISDAQSRLRERESKLEKSEEELAKARDEATRQITESAAQLDSRSAALDSREDALTEVISRAEALRADYLEKSNKVRDALGLAPMDEGEAPAVPAPPVQ